MKINPQIQWFDIKDMSLEDFDKLNLQRYNIKNYNINNNYKMDNFYVFPVLDMDEKSSTGMYAMCINKDFAQSVKLNLEAWKANQK